MEEGPPPKNVDCLGKPETLESKFFPRRWTVLKKYTASIPIPQFQPGETSDHQKWFI
jgi:hypothetical protein